ncbi:MAG: hypothetical protein HY435_00355 [Candidatus Liptonbacteria bacterium]|nr:hypothetical protein [Candidatus Liptonbacteria bacterium]
MPLEERLEHILEAAIQEFIKTGEPVSSGLLYKRHEFGIRPAQIRNELQELTELGFLDQPYHSAGRIPSDRGYEHFVTQCIEDAMDARPMFAEFQNFFKKSAWPNLAENISTRFQLFSLIDDQEHDTVYKDGLERLIENWDSPKEIKMVVRDIEHLDSRMDALNDILEVGGDIGVFIGKKSPVTKNPELSVVAGKYEDEGGRGVTLVAIGPKRMNYQKVVGVFKTLQHIQ